VHFGLAKLGITRVMQCGIGVVLVVLDVVSASWLGGALDDNHCLSSSRLSALCSSKLCQLNSFCFFYQSAFIGAAGGGCSYCQLMQVTLNWKMLDSSNLSSIILWTSWKMSCLFCKWHVQHDFTFL
jgi:hypothetical protein